MPWVAGGTAVGGAAIISANNGENNNDDTVVITPKFPIVTENNKEGIEGTGEAGDTIVITDSEGNTVTTTVKPDGTWDIEPNPLNQGETGTIEAIDPSGNGSGEQPIKGGDQVAPDVPVVTENNGDSLSGTAEPGSSITVTDKASGNVLGTAVTDGNGNWTITPNPVAEGKEAEATATDAAGNESAPTAVTGGDQVAPNAPVVTENNLEGLEGTGEAGDTIVITDSEGNTVTTTVKPDGTWDIEPNPLDQGETGTIEAIDPSGNGSGEQPIKGGDQVAPDAPVVTENNKEGIEGTGDAGDTIVITDSEGNTVTTTVKPDGTWDIEPNPLNQGETGTIEAIDPSGNGSGEQPIKGGDQTIEPVELNPLADLSNDNTPTISGSAEAGSTVTVVIKDKAGTVIETLNTKADSNGDWNVTAKELADGEYSVSASSVDTAGNASAPVSDTTQIDATPPGLLTIDFNDTGLFDDDGITSDGVIKLSNFEANSTWFYSLNGGNTWIKGEGAGFVIPEGVYVEDAIQIKQTDSFGNSTTQAIEVYKVDKTAPEFPNATLAFDTGTSATDGKTSNGLINVTDLEPGSTWKYSLDGGLNWVEGTGTTFTLLDGSYAAGQIQIEQKDIAGNTSISRLGEIIVDQTLSTPVLSIKDLGSNTSDNLTSDPKVYVSDIETGSIWEYSLDGGQTWTLGKGNSFEAGLFGQNTSYSSNQIQVKQTDVYGNERIGKLSNAVTFDTLRHQLDMKLSDDSGSIKNDFITNNGEVTVSNLPIDLDYWQYSVNGSEFINGTGNSFVLPEGVYEDSDIQIVMFDKAGNKSAIWNAETWVVDTTPPVLQIDALPVGYITSSPVFEGTGNSGDVVTVTISNGSNPQSVTAIVKWYGHLKRLYQRVNIMLYSV